MDNIGARRLHTVLERIVEDISFEAPDKVSDHMFGCCPQVSQMCCVLPVLMGNACLDNCRLVHSMLCVLLRVVT